MSGWNHDCLVSILLHRTALGLLRCSLHSQSDSSVNLTFHLRAICKTVLKMYLRITHTRHSATERSANSCQTRLLVFAMFLCKMPLLSDASSHDVLMQLSAISNSMLQEAKFSSSQKLRLSDTHFYNILMRLSAMSNSLVQESNWVIPDRSNFRCKILWCCGAKSYDYLIDGFAIVQTLFTPITDAKIHNGLVHTIC